MIDLSSPFSIGPRQIEIVKDPIQLRVEPPQHRQSDHCLADFPLPFCGTEKTTDTGFDEEKQKYGPGLLDEANRLLKQRSGELLQNYFNDGFARIHRDDFERSSVR